MWKEISICVLIIILVIIGNYITQRYTEETVNDITNKIGTVKEEINKENMDYEKVKSSMEDVEKHWNSKHVKFSYYMEHDELEKVEAHITSSKSFIESEEYPEAICELDNGVFVLKHIEEKYAFSLENLF